MTTTLREIVSDAASIKKTERVFVTIDHLRQCSDLVDAYRLCLQVSGKSPDQVADEIGLSYAVLAKVLRRWSEGVDRRHMPNDMIVPFMVACGNSIPLQWLMLQWQSLTGVITLPGGEPVRQVDVLQLYDRLTSIEDSLKEMFVARGQTGPAEYSLPSHAPLLNELFDAQLEFFGGIE